MKGQGYITSTLDQTPEAYVVAEVADDAITTVIERYDRGELGAKGALHLRDFLRERNPELRIETLAVVHDCDENAVPYVSDGPLGHGWECGVCGKFLQAG